MYLLNSKSYDFINISEHDQDKGESFMKAASSKTFLEEA